MDEQPFASFQGALAVVTGGGDGIGRSLCLSLAAGGCSLALCDVNRDKMNETLDLCEKAKNDGAKVTAHVVDVSQESQVLQFADDVAGLHVTRARKILVFNNAGIGSAASFLGDRAEWENCFNVCWGGVYYMTRAFLPLLLDCKHGYIINTSSVCGFWGTLGFLSQLTAYSAAKFAVKGFTEALINDLKLNAPHIRAAVVLPGHIGTSIAVSTAGEITPEKVQVQRELATKRARAVERLRGTEDYSKLESTGQLKFYLNDLSKSTDEEIGRMMMKHTSMFSKGGMTPDKAAEAILRGVRRGEWRILVGMDAKMLDEAVRAKPSEAYDPDFPHTFFAGIKQGVKNTAPAAKL